MQPCRSLLAIALSSCTPKVYGGIQEEVAGRSRHEGVGREWRRRMRRKDALWDVEDATELDDVGLLGGRGVDRSRIRSGRPE